MRVQRSMRMPLVVLTTLVAVLRAAAAGAQDLPPGDLDHDLRVPLDHSAPDLGQATITWELGAAFDPAKPTVFVLADAQQFFLTRGSVSGIQRSSFGSGFNVVGVIGRGASAECQAATRGADDQTDWLRAWQIFRSEQWVEDIEAVRRELVGADGTILLNGASGGGYLAVEYIARHPDHVSRAFIACAIAPFLVGELGLNSDHFSEEVRRDPHVAAALDQAVARHQADRETMLMTLQRQNFFVPPEKLPEARAALIAALATGDDERYVAAQHDYQVDAIKALLASPAAVAIRVREFEFLRPTRLASLLDGPTLYPDIENQFFFAKPLMALADAGAISISPPPAAGIHGFTGQVFILAGRRDHTSDYRASMALAASFPHHELFIADDDHMFAQLNAAGLYQRLQTSFLLRGPDAAEFKAALGDAEPSRWRER